MSAFLAEPPTAAFALRWRSPSQWLGGPVPALAWSTDGTWLATAGADGRVRLGTLPDGLDGKSATALLGAPGPRLLALAFTIPPW